MLPQHTLWNRIGDAISGVLDTTTIKDLIESGESDIDGYMFYI